MKQECESRTSVSASVFDYFRIRFSDKPALEKGLVKSIERTGSVAMRRLKWVSRRRRAGRWDAGERRVRSSVSVPGSEQRPRQGRRRCKFLQVHRDSVHRAPPRRLRARRSLSARRPRIAARARRTHRPMLNNCYFGR